VPPFVEQITRDDLTEMIDDFIDKTKRLVQKALREVYTGAIEPSDIDRVLLEGGSVQMPWVKDMLLDIFNDSNKIYTSERPALDISLGATYYAAMKMGLLTMPDITSDKATKINVEFEVTVPHDIGLELDSNGKKSFFPMIRRGTAYSLGKRSQVFTLSGNSAEEMTGFSLRILERIDRDDPIEKCKLIGQVSIKGLPPNESGKTKLKITLLVEEEAGLVKGVVEELESGFRQAFEPSRFDITSI
jgi:molecular chaperone DnaK (HSP70)